MPAGVYLVTCVANGRRYVGSSKDIDTRWREHRNDLNKKQHCNDHWQKAWNKYGSKQFEWVVLEQLNADDAVLREREQHWIDVLHPEFNASQFAFPTRLGATNDKEHCEKISKGQRKRWAKLSEDERREQSKQIQEGRSRWWASLSKEERSDVQRHGRSPKPAPKFHIVKLTPEERERRRLEWEAGREQRKAESYRKRSEAQKGKPKSDAQKRKLRQSALAQWADPEYRAKHQAATLAAMQDPEVLKRLSESHKGKQLPEEQRRKIGDAQRGRKRDPSVGRKISKAKMGHIVTEETRRKISETKRRKKREQ